MADLKLRMAHFTQMLSYVASVESDGWYYGNHEQFEKRHAEIKEWLEENINRLSVNRIIAERK